MLKRSVDFVLSTVGFILLSPVLLLIVILIRIDSKGPALFLQTRVGLNGIPFTIYKFRTMVLGADKQFGIPEGTSLDSFVFQKANDSRITRVGAFLRRTSLDELPQLLNVMKGDMSLVGPRPEIPAVCQLYSPIEWQRLTVKPGITGLAQVTGRGDLSVGETIEYDLEYVARQSFMLDLRILLRTVGVVLTGRGAH